MFANAKRLDRIALAVVLVAAGAALLMAWRGDRLGVQVVAVSPSAASQDVSTRARIRVQFDQRLAGNPDTSDLLIVPVVEGAVRYADDELLFAPSSPLAPRTTYTVTVPAGVRSQQGRRLLKPLTWSFQTGLPRVVYLAADSTGRDQLFAVAVDLTNSAGPQVSGPPVQLSQVPYGVWDYATAPDGGEIAFAARNADDTSDIWVVSVAAPESAAQVLACPEAACTGAAWSPDGRYLAVSRRNATELSSPMISPPRLWLMNMQTGETAQVLADDQRLGADPRWSADGRWLSYLSPERGGVGIYQVEDGREDFYPSITGEPAAWHPQRTQLVLTEMTADDQQYAVHMIAVDPVTDERVNLSAGETPVEDSAPTWSPDGEWIAFRRKELAGPGQTPGKQLWRMRADGSAAEALTADPTVDHGQPLWSADGRYLVFHKLPLRGPDTALSVWVMDAQSGEQWQIAQPGWRPAWAQ